jgi:hypothetical protein
MVFEPKTMDKAEDLIVIKPCIVREAGADAGRHCKIGDVVNVKGVDKAELIIRQMVCTKDEFAAMQKTKTEKK